MHPQHAPTWRTLFAMAAVVALCGARSPGPHEGRFPRTAVLDSLFYAARYDTLRLILPALVHDAEARGDSTAVGRWAFQRGRVEITLGHQAAADSDFDRAIRLTEASGDTLGLVRTLNFKAFVLRDQGHFDEAMALFERERDLARRINDITAEANAIYNLAYRDLRRGQLESAKVGFNHAMELYRRSGSPYSVAGGASGMGLLSRALGDTDAARRWHLMALRISREHGFPLHELWSLNSLGLLEGDDGDMETTVEYYEAALTIARRIGFDRGQAIPALNLALAWSYLGERERAMSVLNECREVCERAGFNDLETFTTVSLGMLNLDAGRNRRAAALFGEVLNREFVFEALRRSQAAYGLSLALAELDSVDRAVEVLEPYVSPNVTAPDRSVQPYVELTYTDLLHRQGRCDLALERAVRIRDQVDRVGRTSLGVSARLIETSCRRELGDAPRAVAALHAALDSLEIARSDAGEAEWREAYGQHIVDDVIEGCRVMLEYPKDAPRADRVRMFYDTLQRFKTRTLLERIQDPRGERGTPIEGAATRSVTLLNLQGNVLRPGDLLLDVFVSRNQSYLFAVSPDSCRLVPLPGANSTLVDQISIYQELLSASSTATQKAYTPERFAAMQRSLGRVVLGPVADLVAQADRIICAPDGFYSSVPIGTLVTGDGTGMLMESKDVESVPSAAILQWARSERAEADSAAAMIALAAGGAAPLAGALREVHALERRYENVERISGEDSVLATIVHRANRGRILHIAAHARVNDDSPWQSGFWFDEAATDDGGDAPSDRSPVAGADTTMDAADAVAHSATVLRAWEIARTHLPYGLAVLAGCETAGGRATRGEGVLGMTSAFLSAGVPVVVSSLWSVDDRVTARLMSHFYDRLAAGEDVAAALRGAQLAIRNDARTAHPFYWAGFSVVGDGSRVIRPQAVKRPMAPWVVLGLALTSLAGWLVLSRRRSAAAVVM